MFIKNVQELRFDLPEKLTKGSKSNTPPVDDVLSRKCFKGLSLKFHGESNGAIKFFGYKIFNL